MEAPGENLTGPALEVRRAFLAAQRAGSIDGDPVPILSPDSLDDTIDGAASDGLVPVTSPASDMPSIVGYRFLREISHGGQATVFQAVQESTGRNVAVKVIPGGPYLSARNRARFEQEARALATVDHPNVVSILDRGRTADGSFFLVMDYVQGLCLDAHIAQWRLDGGFDPRLILIVFSKIARALAAVHQCGIVHRDLKPSNVLVDSRGDPHVVDFGLAKVLHEADRAKTYTVTGQIIGSLLWASPEQAAGGSAHLDVRSDVYSLGVMLFHGLTGSFPYAVDGSIAAILENIRNAKPKAASQLNRRWAGIDGRGVDAVLYRALAKSPQGRYASAADFAADLDRLLARRPPIAGANQRPSVLTKFAYALAALVLLGAGSASYLMPAPTQEPVTVLRLPENLNSLAMRLVLIPPGQFMMGSGQKEQGREIDEMWRQARVNAPFWLAVTDVTRGQYAAVMGGGKDEVDANLPVVDVSWFDATEFCRRLSAREHRTYRLPTETEWEYACRAGSERPTSGTGKLETMGWFAGNSAGTLHPVAQLSPNCWGIYDMHGDVNQWCSDDYYQFGAAPTAGSRFPPGSHGGSSRAGALSNPATPAEREREVHSGRDNIATTSGSVSSWSLSDAIN